MGKRVAETRGGNARKYLRLGVEVRRSTIHGFGVFALRSFEPGEVVGIFDGPILPVDTEGTIHTVFLNDRAIEPAAPFRFVNHSDDPNSEMPDDGRAVLIALTEICPGDEITFHYGGDWGSEWDEKDLRAYPDAGVEVKFGPNDELGVYALRDFEPGELIARFSGRFTSADEKETFYTVYLEDGRAFELFAPLKYVGHSDSPNCDVPTSDGLPLVAVERVRAGEEITICYDDPEDDAN